MSVLLAKVQYTFDSDSEEDLASQKVSADDVSEESSTVEESPKPKVAAK